MTRTAHPGFNTRAAKVVFDALSTMDPDSALVFGRILLSDSIHWDRITHGAELAKVAREIAAARATRLRKHYSEEAVAKARRGQDNTHEIRVLAEITKAAKWEEREHPRGVGGRFVQDHIRVHLDDARPAMDPDVAERVAGTPAADHLDGRNLSNYQQAYQQIRDMLMPYKGIPDLNPLLHVTIEHAGRDPKSAVLDVDQDGKVDLAEHLDRGDRVATAGVSIDPPLPPTAQAAAVALGGAVGAPRAGAAAGHAFNGVLDPKQVADYRAATGRPLENDTAAGRAFNRLEHGSRLLRNSLGDTAPRQLQFALAIANHVGQYGPEAQKVIGPTADRTAYRYRGTERAPSRRLEQAFRRVAGDGEVNDAKEYRRALTDGFVRDEGWEPGAVLEYFHDKLPNPDLNELHRRSGVIPPSEGIIIDRKGQIAVQSSGYADDWYLPFNLRHLSALKGGQYIRTRTFGGPTSEDIYTGLISGARSLTVVSHNGVYTIDYDRAFRGGRRFNDKAGRMVGRYGQLLDALRSKQVLAGGELSPSRMADLRAMARSSEPDERSPQYKGTLKRLVAEARQDPQLSTRERGDAANEWLDNQALRVKTRDGRVMGREAMIADLVDRKARERFAAGKEVAARYGEEPLQSLQQTRADLASQIALDDPVARAETVASMLGARQMADFTQHMQRAADANRDRLQPLQLNGRGYHNALLALKEQFPYYIDDVRYHPWNEAVGRGGEATHEKRRDTGYVAPRHNRPEAVEAGYFNRDVNGQVKVSAATTRYQNFRVHQGHPKPPVDQEDAGFDAGAVSWTGVDAGAASRDAAVAQANAASLTPAQRQRAADLTLLDHLRGMDTFPVGAAVDRGDGVPYPLQGQSIQTEVSRAGFPHPELSRLFKEGADDQLRSLPEAELHRLLVSAVKHSDTGLLDVDRSLRAAFENGGNAESLRAPKGTPLDRLAEIDRDHLFEGLAYDPGREASVQAVKDAFDSTPKIKRLQTEFDLPGLDAADFGVKAGRVAAALTAKAEQYERNRRMGGGPGVLEAVQFEHAIEGLERATQLHRRYAVAHRREQAEAAVARAAEPEPEVHNQVNMVHLDDLQAMIDAARADDRPHQLGG